MHLSGADDQRLTLDVVEVGAPDTPADDDLLLDVSVVVAGYSAADQIWVVGAAWRHFMDQLRELERTRRGRAELVSASPDEMRIRFETTDSTGHMSASGVVGWQSPDGFRQKLEFGFPFDPGLLATVVRELAAFGA